MRVRLIFCVETIDDEKSDYIYIKEIYEFYYLKYIQAKSIRVEFVYFGGKHGYKSKTTKSKITEITSCKSKDIDDKIIFVFDKDRSTYSYQDSNFVKNVGNYCSQNNYELVWFARDVEDCLIGHRINQSEKTNVAVKFRTLKSIAKVKTILLKNPNPQVNPGSNILIVLDKILSKTKVDVR